MEINKGHSMQPSILEDRHCNSAVCCHLAWGYPRRQDYHSTAIVVTRGKELAFTRNSILFTKETPGKRYG